MQTKSCGNLIEIEMLWMNAPRTSTTRTASLPKHGNGMMKSALQGLDWYGKRLVGSGILYA